jgi:hypothetical protein
MGMYSPPPVPRPANQGKSAPSTEATPMVQASFPHDTFRASPTPEFNKDPFGVGRGTKGSGPVAANPVPPRCC